MLFNTAHNCVYYSGNHNGVLCATEQFVTGTVQVLCFLVTVITVIDYFYANAMVNNFSTYLGRRPAFCSARYRWGAWHY